MTSTSDSAAQRTYPHGVPCWVQTDAPDAAVAAEFYGSLFGWTFSDSGQPGAPYLIGGLGGRDVAAIGQAAGGSPSWLTYISVTSADESAAAVTAAGGKVLAEPSDAGPNGRAATCADPSGAVFLLWQPGTHPGAQLVNEPGSWNFSHLHAAGHDQAKQFYGSVFGWQFTDPPFGGWTWIQVPGYGDYLAATVDPGIYQRQEHAPPGFADVVGGLMQAGDSPPHWQVTFSVPDRDAGVAAVEKLGGTVLSQSENRFTKLADVRDPWGAGLTLSQFLGAGG